MATFITRAEFKKKVDELTKVLAGVPEGTYICEVCHVLRKIDKKQPDHRDLHCWCDYESQDIEP